MKKRILLGVIFTTAIAAWAADKFQPLNVKPGLWQWTTTITRSGQMPIPPQLLSRITPEQRARLEERMKANSGAHSTTTAYKSCLTKEKLGDPSAFGKKDKECTETILSSTATKITGKMDCTGQGMKGSGTLAFEAVSSENMKGSGHTTVSSGSQTMNVTSTTVGKWLGAACGNVE